MTLRTLLLVLFRAGLVILLLGASFISIAQTASAQSTLLVCQSNDPRIKCMNEELGVSNPFFTLNALGDSLVYWDSVVSRDRLAAATDKCGLEVLRPHNFRDDAVENIVRSKVGSQERKVIVGGSCSTGELDNYRSAGHKVLDNSCTQTYLQYRVGASTGSDGIVSGPIDGYAIAYCKHDPVAEQCMDGFDNDSDGRIDYPADPGCTSPTDSDESDGGVISTTPLLTVTKTDGRSTVNAGDVLTYTITIQNNSSFEARNVYVVDVLPSSLSFLSGSDAPSINGQIIEWRDLTIAPYGQRVLTLTVRVDSSISSTVVSNTVQVAGTSATDSTSIVSVANDTYSNNIETHVTQSNTANYNFPINGNNNSVAINNVQTNNNYQVLQAQQELNAIKTLPQTGAGGFTGSLEDTSRFLRRAGVDSTSGAAAFTVLVTTAAAAASFVMRKVMLG